ncbi:MAG: MipA/OmpV family protein [Hyphomicrobiaceae bacterium]|nr:MipA/OmpV family protein [Hyphomicrobiaceae bacterium]
MKSSTLTLLGLAVFFPWAGTQGAAAQGRPEPAIERPVLITVGLWTLGVRPFAGSDDLEADFKPIISLRTPDERDWLILPSDNGGPPIFKTNDFRLGPSFNIIGERKDSDSKILKGLGSIDTAYEVGAFAEFWPTSWLRTRVEVRRGFEGHEGIVANLSADAVWEANDQLRFTVGPRMSFGNDDYMTTYYGISSRQAKSSGLKSFDAGSGIESASMAASVRYKWTEQWATLGYAEVGQLLGDAEKSPIVDRGTDTTLTVGAAVTYTFVFDRAQLPW